MDKNRLRRNYTEKENEPKYSVKLFDSISWNIAFDCALRTSHFTVSALCVIPMILVITGSKEAARLAEMEVASVFSSIHN